ncbi:alpha/beta fold hydrolase [Frigidibacter mobilis]|uniref:Alpha/beta hydrolase n=1 Tax=Frigidibacter mobilis TaxID=1335048 RepID=A0A159Z6E3_9RHOB|nr:alpha/beta hydrolase [Frigidibacter mobilis]AMY70886.1 alpha/beta hydrolase [Frigidibacter mobilis]
MYIDAPQGRLHIEQAGDQGPPVILLSGAGIDNAQLSWKRLMPVLAERHRVFAPDWPKQGKTTAWRGKADHASMLGCVDAVMDHFGLKRAALVGLSQGGAIALSYAIERPERVDRLVAIAPGGILRFPPVVHQLLWLSAKLPWLISGLSHMLLRSRWGVERLVRTGLFAGPSPDFDDVVDDIQEEVRRSGVRASDWQNASIGFRRMKVDLMPDLHRIECPVLFIQGDKDVAVPPNRTREAASRVKDAEFVLLENHGHWPNRQSPDRIAALVTAFLDGRQARFEGNDHG